MLDITITFICVLGALSTTLIFYVKAQHTE